MSMPQPPRRSNLRKNAPKTPSYASIHNSFQATASRRATVAGKPGHPVSQDRVEPREPSVVDRWSGAGSATLHFQELLAQKDQTIQEFTVACTKYKQDADTFCAKAMEWKKKHDVVAKQVLQLQADLFLVQGQRHVPQTTLANDAPITPRAPSGEGVTGTLAVQPAATPPPQAPTSIASVEISELKHIHAREVGTLKQEVSRLHELLRLHAMDTAAQSDVRVEFETYRAMAESELAQLEGDLAHFKAQILVLSQDNADQMLEITAKHAIHDCVRSAQERQRQVQWDHDRRTLTDLREKMAHQQVRLAQTMSSLDSLQAVYDDLRATKEQPHDMRHPLYASHNSLVRCHARVVAQAHQQKRHIQKLVQKKAMLQQKLHVMAVEARAMLGAALGAARTTNLQSQLATVDQDCHSTQTDLAIIPANSPTRKTADNTTASEAKLLQRVRGLQDSLMRRKVREQVVQSQARELRRQLQSLRLPLRSHPVPTANYASDNDMSPTRQAELYKYAVDMIMRGPKMNPTHCNANSTDSND
ncbi:hypothetical protein H310_10805 [Aphanomyces invadans]|uniref:Uncharacterized protein n=1 Tax=Aphanomyces invadans TaxID=157072 RepID=A0A024TQ26_9STRA|nr:hypothetical protein H310_10805 [Aphanomyces invadans]ETV95731.1 hypothetical protein H310_10805 [Aphanomyces invadans]|eukprot:XP_008875482.1 hypothetical protein H310_10805 [Aphanomyces invadans]